MEPKIEELEDDLLKKKTIKKKLIKKFKNQSKNKTIINQLQITDHLDLEEEDKNKTQIHKIKNKHQNKTLKKITTKNKKANQMTKN